RVVRGERDFRGYRLGGGPGGSELAACGLDGFVQLCEVLVGDDGGGARGGAAELVQLALPGGLRAGERCAGGLDLGGGGFLRRVRYRALPVVGGDGVRVEGIEREAIAGQEVVLFPP